MGNTDSASRKDYKSQHQGQFWTGTYEKLGHKPQETLTSLPFTITQPWASFLAGGEPWLTHSCLFFGVPYLWSNQRS